ncbi:MAG: SDR family oxidoreductase [Holophagales bacterium]|jgi:NAD(P)-dependent dehydrogenase (short-subunit alcohol dehydrogenase family)|nr:SDR family oxidoreductase [Holophagales bacterium]
MPQQWVLITGCSTGIGKALVDVCRNYGWGVIATARNLNSLDDLKDGEDLRKIRLDVTDINSIQSAASAVEDLHLRALVNNAGYGQMGPLEALRPDELRLQFETNVIGLQVVTNAFLPLIRRCREGQGRIVHVASVLGRLSIPMAGAYNASKHAVVALAETLRLEIGRQIPVILVEPGAIQSEFRATLKRVWGDLPSRVAGTAYQTVVEHYANKREDYAGQHGMSAEDCALRIFNAMNAEHPPRRVVIGADSFWAQIAKKIVPAPLWEYLLRRMNGIV